MAIRSRFHRFAAALLMAAAAMLPARQGFAEIADLAQVPLANSPSDAVLPNLMYILDDSGLDGVALHARQHLAHEQRRHAQQLQALHDAACSGPGGTGTNGHQCGNIQSDPDTADNTAEVTYGEAPFYASRFNKIWYNPDITYAPGIDYLGVSLGNANPNSAKDDAYLAQRQHQPRQRVPEVYYCNVEFPSRRGPQQLRAAAAATASTTCRPSSRASRPTSSTGTAPARTSACRRRRSTTRSWSTTSNAHYFTITPHEYCSDANLVNCVLANAAGASPGSPNTIAAPIRYCRTAADATATAVISGNSGGTPRCQKKYDRTNYPFPRYGRFTRTDIVATTAELPEGARTPCAPIARPPPPARTRRRSRTSPTGGRITAPAWRS